MAGLSRCAVAPAIVFYLCRRRRRPVGWLFAASPAPSTIFFSGPWARPTQTDVRNCSDVDRHTSACSRFVKLTMIAC